MPLIIWAGGGGPHPAAAVRATVEGVRRDEELEAGVERWIELPEGRTVAASTPLRLVAVVVSDVDGETTAQDLGVGVMHVAGDPSAYPIPAGTLLDRAWLEGGGFTVPVGGRALVGVAAPKDPFFDIRLCAAT
mgnify:CR=1 FL=1